jgi:hypothetical protein
MTLPRRNTLSNPSTIAKEKQSKAQEEKTSKKKEYFNTNRKSETKFKKIAEKNKEVVTEDCENSIQNQEEKKTCDVKISSVQKTEILNNVSSNNTLPNSKK